MMTNVPVSVVVPCFRSGDTIRRAIASVAAQTWVPSEVILVDDCSDDGTVGLLHEIAEEHAPGWIKVVELDENSGPGTARNVGWGLATQTFVAFLDADDHWHPEKIRLQCRWMLDEPGVALTCHGWPVYNPAATHRTDMCSSFDEVSVRSLLLRNSTFTSTVMVRRSISHRFPDGRRHSEDYFLWLSMRLDGLRFGRSPEPLAFRHKAAFGEGGLSADLWRMECGELENFRTLFQLRKISGRMFCLATSVSLIKFARRLLLSMFYKLPIGWGSR